MDRWEARLTFTLPTHGRDKYTRTIADVLLPDGTNVNHNRGVGGQADY